MKKIDWKARIKNPAFWIGIIGVAMSPVMAYMGLAYTDLTTWRSLGDVLIAFVSNPYLIGSVAVALMSSLGIIVDPSTPGLGDGDDGKTGK